MTPDEMQSHIDRLTSANLELIRKLQVAEERLHDRFMLAAISGSSGGSGQATELANRAKRIADACMRVRAEQ